MLGLVLGLVLGLGVGVMVGVGFGVRVRGWFMVGVRGRCSGLVLGSVHAWSVGHSWKSWSSDRSYVITLMPLAAIGFASNDGNRAWTCLGVGVGVGVGVGWC